MQILRILINTIVYKNVRVFPKNVQLFLTGAGRFAECRFAELINFFTFILLFNVCSSLLFFFFMMLMMMLCFIFSKSTLLNGFSSMRFCLLFNMSSSLKISRFLNLQVINFCSSFSALNDFFFDIFRFVGFFFL